MVEDQPVELFQLGGEPRHRLFRLGQLRLCRAGLCCRVRAIGPAFLAGPAAPVFLRFAAQDEVDVILHAAGIFARRAFIDQHQPVGGQFDHVAIMADQDDRARIVVERLDQRLARIDIEMVGRFVEDQEVRRIAGDQRQSQPRPFPAGQFVHPRLRARTRKAETAQLRAYCALRRAFHRPVHEVERRVFAGQFLDLILREIAHFQPPGRVDLALCGRKLRCEEPRQRGLAIAVAAKQRDAVVRLDAEIEPPQDGRRFAIAHCRLLERDHRRTQLFGVGKVEAQRGVFHQRRDRLHPRQHLGARLRLLGGGGTRAVARDVILQPRALRILRGLCRRQLRGAFGALLLERIVAARI